MKRGFSLVELSIVLVILGLLTGGILAGQSLIRASELRAVTTEYNRYIAATKTFRDKYFALPGDMINATSFWGVAHTTPATCTTTVSTTALTCNGNGDGALSASTGSNEPFRYWQHLANASLVEGSYNGVEAGGTAAGFIVSSTNIPRSKLQSSYWFAYNWGTTAGDASNFAMTYDNIFLFGGFNGTGAINVATLKPEELWNIDTKLDDGRPGYGKLVARFWATCTTAANQNDLAANYLLTSSGIGCIAIFRQIF
jgi:prepilin-type N-terminal cleavage/methylation domain-containing protein